MFINHQLFHRNFAPGMRKTERQKKALNLATDYLGFLIDQETLARRVVDERLEELHPKLEALIDERIRQVLAQKKQ